MASVLRTELINKALTASESGSKVSLEPYSTSFIGYLDVSANDGATTVTAKIQHSADGTNWIDLGSFAAVVNTTSVEAIQITDAVLPNVRADVTLAGTPSATVSVSLYSDKRK